MIHRGYGEVHIGHLGDDFKALVPNVLATCTNKAQKDYSNCTLVVAIEPLTPFPSFEAKYEEQIAALASEIANIRFKAK